ncbi:MAG TPA: hypothetical protein VIU39_08365, partial [Anaerolineales bacterium]
MNNLTPSLSSFTPDHRLCRSAFLAARAIRRFVIPVTDLQRATLAEAETAERSRDLGQLEVAMRAFLGASPGPCKIGNAVVRQLVEQW